MLSINVVSWKIKEHKNYYCHRSQKNIHLVAGETKKNQRLQVELIETTWCIL